MSTSEVEEILHHCILGVAAEKICVEKNVESCVEKTSPTRVPEGKNCGLRIRSEPDGIGGLNIRTKSDREGSKLQREINHISAMSEARVASPA
ncbi:hypothetical protein KCU74_g61, partial [Aureobasidium melanogenum]